MILAVCQTQMQQNGAHDGNRILAPKHTNLVGLRVEPNLALLWMLSWEISIKQQQKMLLKRLKTLNNQPKIG